jgi:cellulose synthase (UDP-forming)
MILTALAGAVTDVHLSASGRSRTHTVEILDFNGTEYDYLCLLYDRVPTLPQSLQKDFGIFRHLWQNIAHRVARTRM